MLILTQKQNKALLALLTQPTREAAAKAAGITSKTLRSYLDDPAFLSEYEKALSGLVKDATRQAQQSLSPALSTLREIVEDSRQPATARISAARSLLEYSLRLTEITDILDQLRELENRAIADRLPDIEGACRLLMDGKLAEAQNKYNH